MRTIDATSEVFMTAFRALPKKAREAVIGKMLGHKEFREDLMDATIIEQRRKEPSRPLEKYLSGRRCPIPSIRRDPQKRSWKTYRQRCTTKSSKCFLH